MTTVDTIATFILEDNGYVIGDFPNLTLTILERRIDDAIHYLNLRCGLSIADLTGTPEAKSIVASDGQILVVKSLVNLFLTAYNDKGATSGAGPMTLTHALANADQKAIDFIIKETERLKDPPIYVGKDTTGLDSE